MLTYLDLRNFKSFSNIKLDLRKAYGEPKNFAFIYGENGSGKSNLIAAMMFLLQSLDTIRNQSKLNEFNNKSNNILDTINDEKIKQQIFSQFIKNRFLTLFELVDKYITIGSDHTMSLRYGFRINGADGSYYMEFNNNKIVFEELRYQINERGGTIFSVSEDKVSLSPTIFFETSYKRELLDSIEKYWGRHSFMSIVFNEIDIKNGKYIQARVGERLLDLVKWFSRISVWCNQSDTETAQISIPFRFLRQLKSGKVKKQDDKELKICESILNEFFTHLYSDVKSAYYSFSPEENEYRYELFFKKQIDGDIIDVPVSIESTGTHKLLDIFPILVTSIMGSSVFIDEIDSGIHDLLMKNLLESLKESLDGQFIATTHNTLLMESLPAESTYIINIDASGEKEISSVIDYKQRTQKNHSIRSKYLRGDYGGIPYSGYYDFDELMDNLKEVTQLNIDDEVVDE